MSKASRRFRANDSLERHVANVVDGDLDDLRPTEYLPPPNYSPTTVYYLHTADHVLLYVGISASKLGISRFKQHATVKDWWDQVAYASMEHFDTREAALDREAYAIYHLEPRHNERVPQPVRRNKYGVRMCSCGCRAAVGDGQRTSHRCISRRYRERKEAEAQ